MHLNISVFCLLRWADDDLQSYVCSLPCGRDTPAGLVLSDDHGLLGPIKCTLLILWPYRLYAGAHVYAAVGVTLYLAHQSVAGIVLSTSHSRERQPIPIPTSAFFREPLIQQSLVSTVKRSVASFINPILAFAVLQCISQSLPITLSGPNDHDTRVETVWPARIGACGQRVRVCCCEQVGQGAEGEHIGIKVDDCGENGGKAEEVEFGQC
jgi:hypothetical protein